jgi:hypothetical protein
MLYLVKKLGRLGYCGFRIAKCELGKTKSVEHKALCQLSVVSCGKTEVGGRSFWISDCGLRIWD